MTTTTLPQPHNGHPPLPSLPIPQVEEECPDLGMVLSPSQTKTFLTCPARWCYKYLQGLADPPTGALVLGTSVHTAIGANFSQKILTKRDLDPADVRENFRHAWREKVREATLRDDEDPGDLEELGAALVDHYMREAAPAIQPAAVELPVAGEIAGVQVRGFIDLVEADGRIVDLKTAAKRPAGINPGYKFQLTTYDLLCPQSRGQARLDTLVKTKTVQLIQQSTEIGPSDVRYAEAVYPMVQDAIRDGIFYPRRESNLCSRRNCPFWRECEKEYGGEVEP